MTADDILSNAFVVTSGGTRLAQFRKCLDAVGLDGSLPREWRWCRIEGEGSMGNAVAQYSLVRHALEAKLPFLVVFEDDAVPCDDAAEALVRAFEGRSSDTLCLSLGWSYDSDPEKGDDRGAKRRVYGSHAYTLFGEKAYLAYIEAWEKNGRADVVLGLMEGSRLAPDNMFAQHTPADAVGIHLPAGWTVNAAVEADIDGEVTDRFSKSRAVCEPEMHVAYTVDIQGPGAVQFADQLLASLFSLRVSMASDEHVCAHVLYGNLPGDLVRRLYALQTKRFRVELKSIPAADLAYMQQFTTGQPGSVVRSWSGIVFARLWIPRMVAADRVVYLDTDTLVRQSLKDLWNTDLEGNLLGMVPGSVYEYGFNSGVVLMDCAAIRAEEGLYKRLHEFLAENARKFYCPDQTAINEFFRGRIKKLGPEWNYPPNPGGQDTKGTAGAAVWHFYNGGFKPKRLAIDDCGRAYETWLTILRAADAETSDLREATNKKKGA